MSIEYTGEKAGDKPDLFVGDVWELIAVPRLLANMLLDDITKLRDLYLGRLADPRAIRERAECVIASALCFSRVANELLAQAEAEEVAQAQGTVWQGVDLEPWCNGREPMLDPPERPFPALRDAWVQRTGGYDALGEADRTAAALAYKSWQIRRPAAARQHDLAAYVAYRQSAYQAHIARQLFAQCGP